MALKHHFRLSQKQAHTHTHTHTNISCSIIVKCLKLIKFNIYQIGSIAQWSNSTTNSMNYIMKEIYYIMTQFTYGGLKFRVE
jgi:hypothetical protein